MQIDLESVGARRVVWTNAQEMVTPLIEEHGLQETRSSGMLFVSPSPNTVVEQHLDAIERVANWLLEPNS